MRNEKTEAIPTEMIDLTVIGSSKPGKTASN
jgi:hypothetical protein